MRRRRKMSLVVIQAHRQLCRKYRDLYKSKLLTNKPSSQLVGDLEVDVLFYAICLVYALGEGFMEWGVLEGLHLIMHRTIRIMCYITPLTLTLTLTLIH